MTMHRSPSVRCRPVGEGGFSLAELLIAITITLTISGAIYGLLAQGQNAFRREPEISDRQQQIRIAMDLIQRDIVTAGMSMPDFVQAFTPGLDAEGPPNAQGVATDFLELVGYDGACMPLPVCNPSGNPPIVTMLPTTCHRLPCPTGGCPLVAVRPGLAGDASSIRIATGLGGAGGCVGGVGVESITLGAPIMTIPEPHNVPGDDDIKPIQIVRYEIAVDANGIPSLWRSARGGLNDAPVYVPAPGAGSDWQLVATGIEDLQVDYRTGQGLPGLTVWQTGDDLLPIPAGNYSFLVREVRVLLTARTTGQANLQGESYSVAGVRAIRGSLTSVTAPRAALFALSTLPAADPQVWQ